MRKVNQANHIDLLALVRANKKVAQVQTGERHASVYLMAQLILAKTSFKLLHLSAKNDACFVYTHCLAGKKL